MSAAASVHTKAQRKAKRIQHAAALRLPGVEEFITCNDDFTDVLTDIFHLARTRKPLAIGGQETKGRKYGRKMRDLGYGSRQRMADESTQGVMVAWNFDKAEHIGAALHHPARIGGGWVPIIEPRPGDDMLTRGVVWQDLRIKSSGVRIRVASYHRPPKRHAHLWPEADRRLQEWLDASPFPVVMLTDANEPGGPDVDDDWGWAGSGIDGAVTDVRVLSVYALAYRNSDHRPVSLAARPASIRRAPRPVSPGRLGRSFIGPVGLPGRAA